MTPDELLSVQQMRDLALRVIDQIHDHDDAGKLALCWATIGHLATGLAQLAERHNEGSDAGGSMDE